MDDRMIPLSVLREYMPKLKDEDLKELGPVEYDQSKVPEVSKKHAENVRRKVYLPDMTESFARGVEYSGLIASEAVDISNETKGRQDNVETQFNSVQQELTDKDVISAPEIIAARGDEPTLSARLDKEQQEVNAQLAQTADDMLRLGVDVEKFRTSLDVSDSDAINAAINYVYVNGGGEVLLTKPLYDISTKINIKSNVDLLGKQLVKIRQVDESNLKHMLDNDSLTVKDIKFKNIEFDLNVENQSDYVFGQEPNIGRAVFIGNNSKGIEFDNVKVKEMFGNAIYVADSENVIFNNSEINDLYGRYITGLYLVRVKHAKVYKSRFIGQRQFEVSSSSYGVQAKGECFDIVVDDCYFEKFQCLLDGSATGGSEILGSNFKITNNVFQSPAADTTIRYCKMGVISNNIVRDSGDYGLSVGDSTHVLVTANEVEGSNTVGIGVRKSSYSAVLDNIVRDPCKNFRPNYPLVQNQRVGIYVVGDSRGTIVKGNSVTDFNTSPSQMFHAIRVEDYAGGVKGNDKSWAIIGDNVCYGSSSDIDIYADGVNNKVNPTNLRNDNRYTGISLGAEPFASSKLGDLRHNVITQKPYFYDGSAWRNIPKQVTVPATPTSPGKAGDVAMNSSYFYWCPSDNIWCRVPKDANAW